MAVKKTMKKKEASATPAKAAKVTAKKAPKKKAAPAASSAALAPAPAAEPATKPAAKKAAPKKAAAAAPAPAAKPKAAPKPKAAAIKLSSSQTDILTKIGTAGEAGYKLEKKAEQKSLDLLKEKKMIKAGKKDKADGSVAYTLSAAGKKYLATAPKA